MDIEPVAACLRSHSTPELPNALTRNECIPHFLVLDLQDRLPGAVVILFDIFPVSDSCFWSWYKRHVFFYMGLWGKYMHFRVCFIAHGVDHPVVLTGN